MIGTPWRWRWSMLTAFLLSSFASAQNATLADRFAVERFRLSGSRSGVLDAEWGALPPGLSWDTAIYTTWSRHPLLFSRESDGAPMGALLRSRAGLGLVASMAYAERWGLALEAPFVLSNTRDTFIENVTERPLPPIAGTALGNLRVAPKIGLLMQGRHGVDLALMPAVSLPTGPGRRYAGDSAAVWMPELALSSPFGHLRPVFNLGLTLRSEQVTFLNQRIGNEVNARLGLAYRREPIEIGATLATAVALDRPFEKRNETSLEFKGYVAVQPLPWVQLFAGAGTGLLAGWGTPDVRVLGGIRVGQWSEPSESQDTDGDGVKGASDLCPHAAEDVDGFEDLDGCPDPDNDQDGSLDAVDACPLVAGMPETRGCPAESEDADRDGVLGQADRCPQEPEDRDGFEDKDGCPEKDNDKDGVDDEQDACPVVAGLKDNKGCPVSDRDGDGVEDSADECPDEKGEAQGKGCPPLPLATLEEHEIFISDNVYFKRGKALIVDQRSHALLNEVAEILKNHLELKRVRIVGHTDSYGSVGANVRLSRNRARSVMRYLISQGVPAERLMAVGVGEALPGSTNYTLQGRAKNRRVEFQLMDDDVKPRNSGRRTKLKERSTP